MLYYPKDAIVKTRLSIVITILFMSLLIPTCQYLAYGQTSNGSNPFDIPGSKSVLTKNETSLSNLHGKYTANEINEIISHLYDDLRSDRMIDHNLHHNIAILLFICGDKRNEIAVPACDISTEIPID